MRPLRCLLAAAALAVLTTAPRAAHAQDARAKALFEEGMVLFQDGKFPLACPKFEESLKLFNGLGTRGKLAECYEKQGLYVLAWNTYTEVALLAHKSADTAREQVAHQRAKHLDGKVGRVKLVFPPPHDLPGLTLTRNNAPVARERFGAEIAVEPGLSVFDVSAPGHKPASGRIIVSQGQLMRFEIPLLEPDDSSAGAAAASSGTGEPRVTPPEPAPDLTPPPPADAPSPRPWQKPLGLGLAGAGAVALGIGAVVGLAAKGDYDQAFDSGECDATTNRCSPLGQSQVDSAYGKASGATILFVAGALVTGGGAALFFTAPKASTAAAWRVAPTVSAHGGGLVWSGSLGL